MQNRREKKNGPGAKHSAELKGELIIRNRIEDYKNEIPKRESDGGEGKYLAEFSTRTCSFNEDSET
jgi:hypothetical protein